jgi:hypothetical protein
MGVGERGNQCLDSPLVLPSPQFRKWPSSASSEPFRGARPELCDAGVTDPFGPQSED